MHLGFDAKRLFNNFTGLGNYSRTLLRELAHYAPEHSYFLFSPRIERNEETAYFFDNPSFQRVLPGTGRRLLWRSWRMISDVEKHKIDVYHGLSHELPLGIERTSAKSVVTIHDLIFRHYPHQYKPWDNWTYARKFRSACERADKVVAISASTKRDIHELFGTPEEKVKVIYQSCDDRFLIRRPASAIEEIRRQYDLPRDYSLYVGSLIERKNLLSIVRALAVLPDNSRSPLVIVGGGGDRYRQRVMQEAQTLGVSRLLLFRRVSFDHLPLVYQGALAFLYPSHYEGFGIPVIEALNSGVPVLTANRSSLPEAGGSGSLLVDPDRPAEIAEGWERMLTDTELVKKMIREGFLHAEKFRSDRVTPQWIDLYQSLHQ